MKNKTNSRRFIGCNSLIQLTLKISLFITLIITVSLSAEGQVFSTPKNISNNPGISQHPKIAMDDEGNIYSAWSDSTDGHVDVFFSRSTDGGRTFSYPMNISHSNISSYFSRITVDGQGFVYLIWADWDGNITFSYSFDHGVTFSPPIFISPDLSGSTIDIAVDSQGYINVVFRVGGSGHWNVWYCRSTNGGESFSAPINLSSQIPAGGSWPLIKVDDEGKIYVVWIGPDGTFFSCSSDGFKFSMPLCLTPMNGWPRFALDGEGNINIIWYGVTYEPLWRINVFFARSTNGGESFSAPINISNSPHQSTQQEIAVDDQGNINVAWWERSEIFFSRSTDGEDFSIPVNVSNTPDSSEQPKIAVDAQGNINIVWNEHNNGTANFFSRSIDEGVNFSESKNLSIGRDAKIAVDNKGDLYIIYHSARDIYFIRSIDSLFQDLIDLIEEINLKQGISKSLDAKLDVALRALEDANENNNVAAIHALEAFITQVEHQQGGQITNEDADALIAAVQNILNMLY